MLENLLRSMRVSQWVKNLFAFAPLVFAEKLADPRAVALCCLAFLAFCLASSSSYLLNDIVDREADAAHPLKRHRPLSSGSLAVHTAAIAAVFLSLAAAAASFAINSQTGLLLLLYLGIAAAYSVSLKSIVILDVMTIAAGFVLRVLAGASAIQVESSHWLLICTTLLALFLGFAKRRQEVALLGVESGPSHRKVLGLYNATVLDQMIAVVTASTLMSYALYTVSEETVGKFQTRGLLFTIPFVLYGIFRYLYLIYREQQGGSPAETLLTDRPLLLAVLLWIAASAWVIYS